MVPVIRLTKIGPKMVITGIKALRSACRKISVFLSNPFAFASVIYSLPRTPIISVLVNLATLAMNAHG